MMATDHRIRRAVAAGGALGFALLVLAAPIAAAGDAPSDPAVPMQEYFDGEKRGGLWLLAMGAAGVGSGAYLHSRDTDRATGASYSLIGFGAVHLLAGGYVYFASDRRIDAFRRDIDADPGAFVDRERQRVRGVETQFLVLKIVEGVMIAGGIGLAVYGEREDEPTLTGVGVGVAIEAGATLLFDIVASRRAGRYRRALDGMRVGVQPDGAGGHAMTAGFAATF
jgi:hypothetical protein